MSTTVRFKTRLFVRDNCLCLPAQRAARSLARHSDALLRPIGLTNQKFSLRIAPNAPTFAPKQIDHGTGAPPTPENTYTEDLLRTAFGDITVLYLRSDDSVIRDGSGHDDISALIDLVAERPAAV